MLEKSTKILDKAKEKLNTIIKQNDLSNENIKILVKTLSPEEAIGNPGRRDFPIIEGKERVIEAELLDSRVHVFTDSPSEFIGTINEIMELPLDNNRSRAVFIAMMNVVLKNTGQVEQTIHCRDEEPEDCAAELAEHVKETFGSDIKIGLIGLNPAMAEALINAFKPENIYISDRNPDNIDKIKYSVRILDASVDTEKLVKNSDLIILTGTTLVNATFDDIYELIQKYNKNYLIYGVTATGICHLLDLNRICFYGRTI